MHSQTVRLFSLLYLLGFFVFCQRVLAVPVAPPVPIQIDITLSNAQPTDVPHTYRYELKGGYGPFSKSGIAFWSCHHPIEGVHICIVTIHLDDGSRATLMITDGDIQGAGTDSDGTEYEYRGDIDSNQEGTISRTEVGERTGYAVDFSLHFE